MPRVNNGYPIGVNHEYPIRVNHEFSVNFHAVKISYIDVEQDVQCANVGAMDNSIIP